MRKTLVSIIAVCVLAAVVGTSVFAEDSVAPDVTLFMRHNYYYNIDDTRVGGFRIEATSFKGEFLGRTTLDRGSSYSSGRYEHTERYHYQYKITLFFYNNSADFVRIDKGNTYYTFKLSELVTGIQSGATTNYSWTVTDDNQKYMVYNTNDTIQFYLWDFRCDDGGYYIPPYYNYTYNFYMNLDFDVVFSNMTSTYSGYSVPSATISAVYLSVPQNIDANTGIISTTSVSEDPGTILTDYNIHKISNNLQNIVDAYTSNYQNIDSTNNQIDSTQSTIDNVHSQEQTWYAANQQAIESTGLHNASLSDNQYQGIYPVANDFNQLWIAIGPTKWIYLFTLMCSLAAFMLRHKPFSHAGAEIGYQTRSAARQERKLNK